jgi:large subunit ribosomal protein L17
MRHSRVINHLGRTSSHRKSMLANMASSLILHKRISTTTAKAKALRTYVEPLITKSKEDSTHSRRVVFSYLKDKEAVSELFRDISPKISERPGGYTRILKIGNRIGDNADMCILELVDYNVAMLSGEVAKTKTTRRRRTTKKNDEAGAAAKAPKAPKAKAEKPATKVDKKAGEAASEE